MLVLKEYYMIEVYSIGFFWVDQKIFDFKRDNLLDTTGKERLQEDFMRLSIILQVKQPYINPCCI